MSQEPLDWAKASFKDAHESLSLAMSAQFGQFGCTDWKWTARVTSWSDTTGKQSRGRPQTTWEDDLRGPKILMALCYILGEINSLLIRKVFL